MKINYPKISNKVKGCAHLWFRLLAAAMNDSGQGMKACFEDGKLKLEVDWTEQTFKQVFWEGYFGMMYPEHDGMADLNTYEFEQIRLNIERAMADVFNITDVPFPSEDDLKNAKRNP
jgi:hypothetical protein